MQTRLLCPSGSLITLVFRGNPPTKRKTTKQNFLWGDLRMDTRKMYLLFRKMPFGLSIYKSLRI